MRKTNKFHVKARIKEKVDEKLIILARKFRDSRFTLSLAHLLDAFRRRKGCIHSMDGTSYYTTSTTIQQFLEIRARAREPTGG